MIFLFYLPTYFIGKTDTNIVLHLFVALMMGFELDVAKKIDLFLSFFFLTNCKSSISKSFASFWICEIVTLVEKFENAVFCFSRIFGVKSWLFHEVNYNGGS